MNLENFRQLFAKAPDKFPSGLEARYPRVLAQMLERWDSPKELDVYLRELVVDDRGTRQGFPPEILREILFISALFEKWRAERKRKVDLPTLALLGPELVDGIERSQRPLSAELAAALAALRLKISRDDRTSLDADAPLFNQQDRDGMTPLMHAAAAGAEQCLIHLLKNKANPHMADSVGNHAIHWAVSMARLRSTEILLFFGADPMAKNRSGATALTLGAIKSDPGIVARLIDYGADPNTPDGRGDFPLHKAVSAGVLDTIKFLLNNGASKEMRNREGKTPLEIAVRPEVARVFEQHHTDMMRHSMAK